MLGKLRELLDEMFASKDHGHWVRYKDPAGTGVGFGGGTKVVSGLGFDENGTMDVTRVNVASVGHTHTMADITDAPGAGGGQLMKTEGIDHSYAVAVTQDAEGNANDVGAWMAQNGYDYDSPELASHAVSVIDAMAFAGYAAEATGQAAIQYTESRIQEDSQDWDDSQMESDFQKLLAEEGYDSMFADNDKVVTQKQLRTLVGFLVGVLRSNGSI